MMAQDSQRIWQAFLLVLCVAVAGFVLTHNCGCAQAPLSVEDQAHIANHALTLERCKAEGREAGSYAAYDACKKDAGISR